MLEQISNALVFYGFYTASQVGKTGLTVTVDIYKNGSIIVTAASASAVGDGLYSYTLASGSVDAEGEYIAVFKTTDTTVDQRDIPAIWVIQKAGVEDLNATVSSRSSHSAADVWSSTTRTLSTFGTLTTDTATAVWAVATSTLTSAGTIGKYIMDLIAGIWAYATRTITQSAAQLQSIVSGSTLTLYKNTSISFSLTGLGTLTSNSKLWFTVKTSNDSTDAQSVLQIERSVGLVYLNGSATVTAGDGVITVTDATAGNITITLQEASAALLPEGYGLLYDVKVLISSSVTLLTSGTANILPTVTRAIA